MFRYLSRIGIDPGHFHLKSLRRDTESSDGRQVIYTPLRAGAISMTILAAMGAQPALPAAFYIQEQSVTGLGRVFAGQAALAEDASTIYTNPAGMTELPGPEAAAALHVLLLDATVSDRGSTALGAPIAQSGGAQEPFRTAAVPNAFLAAPVRVPGLGRGLWLGLGVTAPFGLSSNYDRSWFGRYDSTRTDLLTIDIAPSIAVAVTDYLSIGAGLDLQYADGVLSTAVPNTNPALGPLFNPATDRQLKAAGTNWAVGFNAGILVKPLETLRLGLHYRSGISHDLDGDFRVTAPNGATLLSGSATASADLPDIVGFGAAWQVAPDWTLLGQVNWFNWSAFNELRLRFSGGLPESVTAENYRDTWSFAVGAEHQYSEALTLRAGVQVDPTPTQDGFRTTQVPDADRVLLGIGASYRIGESLTVDAAYAHVFLEDTEIDLRRLNGAAAIRAASESAIDILSVQLRYRF